MILLITKYNLSPKWVQLKITTLENTIRDLKKNNNDILCIFKEMKELKKFSEVQQVINQNITFEQPGRESEPSNNDIPQSIESKWCPTNCCNNPTFSFGSLFKGCC